ncbi:MAG: MarR family winged helix-turn-helix transcriptional regulator [Pseudomonadota bacterium]
MKRAYLDAVALVERLHRHFLEVVKSEIDRLAVRDVNNIQALILYNMGSEELTVGELTERGYYLGSNVSYNLKKLIDHGYIAQARSPHDRRLVRIRATPKGSELRARLDHVFQRHADELARGAARIEDLKTLETTLRRLETFWSASLAPVAPSFPPPPVPSGARGAPLFTRP